ncbi:glycosyltransferase family 4 protein [Paraburkholderia gardini]|uniref:D-inositol-3-phosphate glycosyltransferase n=1 Tax=Paraburkholderia gardini TaxID=2823469 RepID=A0ABN7QGC1_9BURK|nr:glycosyltransferase family 4 protein [Paraburkholderia gardini]CAG4888387.1 D-inositol-3-phosphate glycosyltransferase [Paraburkholderia gardini]CAG4891697.1 D-inositol-3-phosphate glycosyltransferase [Paraburkholderia gardini]
MSPTIDSLQLGMHWFGERPGGLDRMFMALVKSLPAQGVNVRGLVAGSPAVREASGGVVEAFAAAQSRLGTRLWAARVHSRRLREIRMPDVVATHFALYTMPTTGIFRSVPKVVHFHGPWADESGSEGRGRLSRTVRHSLERFVYQGGTRHIVLSNAFGDLLRTSYRVREDRIHVVPGCVDVNRFDTGVTKRDARERLGLPLDRPQLFCVRRLVSRMGLEDLIDAMFVVKQAVPDVLLTIAGKGPLEPALQARIQMRGLEKQVRLAGFVSDEALPLWFTAADVTVVPTVALEGFGLTTIESLAAGTPVLVTPVGGLPEAVTPLSPDLVLPSGGFHAIGSGLSDALLGRRVLPDAEACRAYARARFDHPVVAAQVARVYREAIDAF